MGCRLIDLFGCSRDRPYARIDLAGLCWLINGNRVVALSEGAAVIEKPSGTRQTYLRKPISQTEAAPVWELALYKLLTFTTIKG
jgi:hypothetical protein